MDKVLGGGIHGGMITDIFGSSGLGKTQLAMQFCTNAAIRGHNVIYYDSSGRFRPERIVEMTGNNQRSLERIKVQHMRNTSDQISSLSAISDDVSLVIVDSVTDLFSFEYKRLDQAREKNIIFMQYMRKLAGHSYERNIPVVVTNMVRSADDRTFENMDGAMSLFTHVKIRLLGRPASNVPRRGTVETARGRYEFEYKVSEKGVSDARIQ